MNIPSYKFSTGYFECMLITDGKHTYPDPAELLFPNVPKKQLSKSLLRHDIILKDWDSWTSDYTCLLVDTGTHLVLMDTGAGAFLSEAGQLVKNMQDAGIKPDDIDIILLSHAHPDHIGGIASFINARIIMNRKEWLFWRNKPELPRLPKTFREILLQMIIPILSSLEDRIELIDGDTEIISGIKMLDAIGHTPGHMATLISSGEAKFMYIGDAILHPVHMENPDWNALVDVLPDKAKATRKSLLTYAVNNHAPIFGFHFPHISTVSKN